MPPLGSGVLRLNGGPRCCEPPTLHSRPNCGQLGQSSTGMDIGIARIALMETLK